jgi:hypothetical protein
VTDTSKLSPSDAAVALRSFPRRFREATALRRDETGERMLERPGMLGRSVIELAVDAVRTLSLLERAFEQIQVSEDPALHPAVTNRRERDFDFVAHGDVESILAELDDVAPSFAERVERTASDDWSRRGVIAGVGDGVTALDVVREAVATAADDLRDIEATVRQFRGG